MKEYIVIPAWQRVISVRASSPDAAVRKANRARRDEFERSGVLAVPASAVKRYGRDLAREDPA